MIFDTPTSNLIARLFLFCWVVASGTAEENVATQFLIVFMIYVSNKGVSLNVI